MRSSLTVRVLLALAVAAAVAVAVPSPRPETVALPPPGSLAGLVSDADRAVWVGHRRDDGSAVAGDTWVVEARVPGTDRVTAWCPVTGQLVDPATDERFDPRGRVVEAAGDGLVPWTHAREGDELVLLERLPRWPNLGLGAADTAAGTACTPDELSPHPATEPVR